MTPRITRPRLTRTRAMMGACALGLIVTSTMAASPVLFTIVAGKLIPREQFAGRITMIGAAIQNGSGGYHIPVTMQVELKSSDGETLLEPFGRFDRALDGNVNFQVAGSTLTGRPLRYTMRGEVPGQPGINPADMEITVTGKSWKLKENRSGTSNNDWEELHMRNSVDDPTLVKVLRRGDPCPALAGWLGQDSVEYFLRQYVDPSTHTMKLGVNEAIFLFELGTSSVTSGAYDLQDLVVLCTLAHWPIELDEQAD